jgi:putative ABC transport system permease protein
MTADGPSRRDESPPVRSLVGLSLRLTRQWWPHLVALAAACGIVAATIAGALGVGDALTQGLRRLALARLGGIQAAVLSDGFFRAELADETTGRLRSQAAKARATADQIVPAIVPAIVMEVSLEGTAGDRAVRTARATLLACNDLHALGFVPLTEVPAADTVAINRVLADSLGARPGDAIVLRITKLGDVPADSPLGRRTADSWSRRLRVAEVLPAEGLGDFSLRPTQVTGGLAITSLATAQAILRRAVPSANVLLSVASSGRAAAGHAKETGVAAAHDAIATHDMHDADILRAAVKPSLDDVGLIFDTPAGSGPWRLSSRRLLLPPAADRAAERVLGPIGGRPTLAFLANAMTPLVDGKLAAASIPYSTVVGIDTTSLPVGDLVDEQGGLLAMPGPDEIVIDRWMADDLTSQGVPVAVGDSIMLQYFLPETLHGRVEEAACPLKVSGIASMRGAAVARDLVPEVEGITDEASIADWDPPFPFDRSRVRTVPPHDEDDRYWKAHGATPKAFVSLDVARRLAGSRFGATTAWHMPEQPGQVADATRAALADAMPADGMGMKAVPLRAHAEAAARGSTPFGSLFLALSSFVVASGLLLEWLLFSLLVAARRRDIGILAAVGWPAARVARLLVLVAGLAAVGGVVVGSLLGPLWARLLLDWLAQAWNTGVAAGSSVVFARGTQAFAGSSLRTLVPAAIGAAAVSLVAAAAAAWRAARLPPLTMLKSGGGEPATVRGRAGPLVVGLAAVGPALAVALAWWARRADPQAAVGLFFGAGFAALAGLLAGVRLLLGRTAIGSHRPLRTLSDLAWRGLTHARSRAFSVAAIVACAEFLIVAVSSFAVHPPQRPQDRDAPTGGWTFMATFGSPTGIDPADPVARESLGLSDADREALSACTIARIRSSAGDDASCVNLYAPTQPTVLGVGASFIERGGFRFVDPVPGKHANPWTLLDREAGSASAGPENTTRPAIPVIIDQATAQWALKLGGIGARFELPVDGGPALFEIVGLLEPGILQGFLIVSERNFERLYPQASGYALALVDAGAADETTTGRVAGAIAAAWADAGVTVTRTTDRLRSLQAVQNTFLAGFQALGTLGLVLGAAGVAAVQFQSVLERRGALSLMAAVGFTGARLRLVVVLETLLMVALGLAVGTLSGCLALVPAFAGGRAGVPVGWIACTWGLTLAAAVIAGFAAARRVARLEPGKVLAEGG